MWSCYLPCLACGFSFDDRFWMETTHNTYDFWWKNWIFLGHFWRSETIFGVITDLCEVVICLVLPVASRLTIDFEWKRLTTLMIFYWKIEFLGHFWHSEVIFGVITDLCEVVICLVLPVFFRLTIDSEWKWLTTLMIFD